MGAQSITTGETVQGLVPGMAKHLGGGAKLMYVYGNPSGVVTPFDDPSVTPGVSGICLAWDAAAGVLYQHVSGASFNVWNALGSYAF